MTSPYILIPIGFLVVAFILRMPIAYGMIIGSIAYFMATGTNVGSIVHLLVNSMMNNYVLMAVPLYIFTANVMNSGAVTDRLYGFVNSVFSKVRGSSAQVNIYGSLLFAGMTGSSVADASGLGMIEVEHMTKEGYDRGFSCALSATSAVLGPTFPPSIIMVIYSTLSNASVGKLFMGGIVPAFLMSGCLSLYVAYMAKKHNFPRGEKLSGREFLLNTLRAIPALLTPVVLLGGIYSGTFSPTEAGAVGALYALVVSFFIYRSLNFKALWRILKDTARTTGNVGMIVMAAYAFSHIVAAEQLPSIIGNYIVGLTNSSNVFLLLTLVVILILGCVFDSNTIQLVFLPTIIPAAAILGVDLVHFGVITSVAIVLGQCTPPFGVLLFITSGLSGTPLKDVTREAIPMVVCLLVALLLITFIPELVMWLPNTMMGG